MTFGFDEHVYEIVMEAFNSLERVVVVGEMIAGKNQALDIKFEGPAQPEPSSGAITLRCYRRPWVVDAVCCDTDNATEGASAMGFAVNCRQRLPACG